MGINHFDQLRHEALHLSKKPKNVERAAWAQVFFSILTQATALATFPSYNPVLGFWGLYVVFSRSYQAARAYIFFLVFTLILDITFCSVWGSNDLNVFGGGAQKFCLAMFILNLFAKTVAVHYYARFHKELQAELLNRANVGDSALTARLALNQERAEHSGGGGGIGGGYDMRLLRPMEMDGPKQPPKEQFTIMSPIGSEASEASIGLSPGGQRRRSVGNGVSGA